MLPEMFRALTEKPETLSSGKKEYHLSKHLRLVLVHVGTGIVSYGDRFRWTWCSILDVDYRIGAASAFMEATLAQVYKVHDKEGGFVVVQPITLQKG